MNKYFLMVFALFAVVNLVTCIESEEVLAKVKSKFLKKVLTDKHGELDAGMEKLDETCPGASEKLKTAIVSFVECDEKVDDSLTICDALQRYTLNCTAPLLKVVEDCLPPKARYLPTFGVKSLLSVADFLCGQSGESIFELANPCIWEDADESGEEDECERIAKEFAGKYKHNDNIPSKTEICTTAISMRSCVQTHTNQACKNQKTKDVVIGLYDAIVAPCKALPSVKEVKEVLDNGLAGNFLGF